MLLFTNFNKKNQKKYIQIINKEIYYNQRNFLKIPEIEQKFIVNLINLPKGIVINNILLEIISLFTCIICRVPLFICGEPGSSKSLSVELLYKAMKGESAKMNSLKNCPDYLCVLIK